MVNPHARVSEEDKLNLKLTRSTGLTSYEIRDLLVLGMKSKIQTLTTYTVMFTDSDDKVTKDLISRELDKYTKLLNSLEGE